jgi:hypothetical protein
MNAKPIGTIYATAGQLRRADAFADRQRAQQVRDADQSKDVYGCEKRSVGGEVRYYRTEAEYAIVSRSGALRWFEHRKDGDYPLKRG